MNSHLHLQTYTPYPSTSINKKYDVWVRTHSGGVKKVSFGAKGYEDYTIHHDDMRKLNYQKRHQHDQINNPEYAGFWSWNLLICQQSKRVGEIHYKDFI